MEGFHDVLAKEHPGAFHDVPWGLFKEMPTNNHGQSDIVTHATNTLNKEYHNFCKRIILYISIISIQSFANVGSSNISKLSLLMPMACQTFVFG